MSSEADIGEFIFESPKRVDSTRSVLDHRMSEFGKMRVSTTPDTVYPVRHGLSQLWQVALNVHVLVKNTHHVDSDIKSQVED